MARDPEVLRPLGRWERLVRGRFQTEHDGATYVVDAHYLDLDERIRLYRDGRLVDVARRRARFPVGRGAHIEAAVAQLGMKYVRLRRDRTVEPEPLRPADGTPEAWRARVDREHPVASRVVGGLALAVVLVVLALELPQLVNLVGTAAPLVGLDEFRVPAPTLAGWSNVLLVVLGGAAGLERGLSMRYHPLLDD